MHEELAEEAFEKLVVDAQYGALWFFFIELDLRERVVLRWQQKMTLGRYGRQPLSWWEGRPVTEIDRAMHALNAVIEREDRAGGATEEL